MHIFVGFRFSRSAEMDSHLRELAELCSSYVPASYSAQPYVWIDSASRLGWIAWTKHRATARAPNQSRQKLVLNGYVTHHAGHEDVADALAESIAVAPGSISMRESPGGVAAFCLPVPRLSSLFAWTTQPPAIGLYWVQTQNFCAISTRPLLCHLSASGTASLRLQPQYAVLHLAAESATDGSTPYAGVRRLSANRTLCIDDLGVREIEHPLAGRQVAALPDSEESQTDVLAEALKGAVRPLTASRSCLLMSGGKDSRLVAAAVAAGGGAPAGLVFGADDGGEVEVARQVGDVLGFPVEARAQTLYADPLEAVRRSHARTEGLVLSVPHQARFADPAYSDDVVGHGHGHLLRGGFAHAIGLSPAQVRRKAESWFVTGWVKPEYRAAAVSALDKWWQSRYAHFPPAAGLGSLRKAANLAASRLSRLPMLAHWLRTVSNPAVTVQPEEALYWINHDLRLGPWSTPGQLEYDGLNRMCYPLLDERVVQVAHGLALEQRTSERAVFRALRKLAPQLADLPLYGSMWRFETAAEIPGFEGRARRIYHRPSTRSSGAGVRYLGDMTKHSTGYQEISRVILDSATFRTTLKPMLHDAVVAQIEAYAAKRGETVFSKGLHAGARGSFQRKVPHVFVLCALYELDWLRPRSEPSLSGAP